MIPNIQVGTIAIATLASGVCDVGETGVCYEVCELADRPGYSFIFERGRYDGFSLEDVEMFLHVTDRVAPGIEGYEFRNVTRLLQDFREGRFADAFPLDKETQQFRICPHCNEESIRQAQVTTTEQGWENHPPSLESFWQALVCHICLCQWDSTGEFRQSGQQCPIQGKPLS